MYIGQAAQRSGTTIKSIRHYESIGLLPTPRRQGNYRLYDQQSVELLIFIKCAKDMGFRLKELQAIFCEHHGEAMPWALAQQAIEAKKSEINRTMAELTRQYAQLEGFEVELERARVECPLEKL
ncbi:MerR family transcriptional regulator [Pseudomonas iridis]|uniref:MerR family transcriptional regulator n=2 Tax=Pseudomonas TaxID=286 RepID=A0A9X4HFZ7_9PSED|nr:MULTISPECIES: MerR family transcriptional regulator [Pseudomonas]MBA4272348.1 MerR family DNA-binding transcriptional regulator [Pseudomonas sp.]MBK3463825.1 MerR family transcriptional regulator [Pseudomonas sp. MF6776]MBP5953318.1 MerR family transcriptional regulator [Pseudomonas sp. P42]MDD1011344.1 MerR family transcriptional regulator [Pseudomonas shahriarae]CEL27437.1 HTH-type transcriptional regulator HmrR [Pseudomonas fluorescens]